MGLCDRKRLEGFQLQIAVLTIMRSTSVLAGYPRRNNAHWILGESCMTAFQVLLTLNSDRQGESLKLSCGGRIERSVGQSTITAKMIALSNSQISNTRNLADI
jgi:hypothetical protein